MVGKVIKNREVIDSHFLLSVKLPASFPTPMPGQFVLARQVGPNDPLLGRPFSVYHFDRRSKEVIVEILYKVVGRGTMLLTGLKRGSELEIFGPYGNAFDIVPHSEKAVFICGGIGVAPIVFLASHYKTRINTGQVQVVCYIGATCAEKIVGLDRMREDCSDVFISTDDGSMGYKGSVTEMFTEGMSVYNPENTNIYACGPRSMLKRLSETLLANPIPCQVSLEERMACGLGACLGCSVETNGRAAGGPYMRVCKDGPVFNIQDIAWG